MNFLSFRVRFLGGFMWDFKKSFQLVIVRYIEGYFNLFITT
jgi:hypothetical protein